MKIETFIEKSKEGGWKGDVEWRGCSENIVHEIEKLSLLDPKAWKGFAKSIGSWTYKPYMYGMVDSLICGRNIEEYLDSIYEANQ